MAAAPAAAAAATSPPSPLRRFKEAMQIVYGPFEDMTPEEAARWVPPDKPGAGGHRGRYLWTDAFGVVNFVTLARATGNAPLYLTLARRLVATVHDVLGRERDGRARLPGASDASPLRGGLRIGKMAASGPDGDGQYHHYLTLWMFALNRLALAEDKKEYNDLAVQLAESVHPRFVLRPSGGQELKMVWKVSTDMRTVLVPSEGHLDAATGYVVYRLLQRADARFHPEATAKTAAALAREIDDYARLMHRPGRLSASQDPLDLGMCLWMAHFFASSSPSPQSKDDYEKEEWAASLGAEALHVASRVVAAVLRRDPSRRLAFREFGTCLGVRCFDPGDGKTEEEEEVREVREVREKAARLVDFWEAWMEQSTDEEDLRPISLVMYAAALVPGAFKKGYLD